MQRHHKLHCGPFQNLFLSFLIWSINQRLSASPSVQPRRSWSWWTRRGLWCAGRVSACQTWTVTKSLGGSPAAAWQESWSSPAHRRSERSPHTNRLSRCVESSQKASKERPDERTEEDPRRDSQRHCTLRWRGHKRLDRPSWEERRGKKKKRESGYKRLRWKPDVEKRKAPRKRLLRGLKLCPTGGKTLIERSKKLFRWLIYFL